MTNKVPKNSTASVRQRLLNLAHASKEEFGLMLLRYSHERLLFRLARSEHGDQFVVKGATLFALWTGEPHRATRDLDLLGVGEPDLNRLRDIFQSLCRLEGDDDGLRFDPTSVQASRIREDQDYEGIRLELVAFLGTARVPVQVDVGFGDAVTPAAKLTTFPTLLDLPAPRLKAYPQETVIAEKLHAMTVLGMANSRMKDFYDVWTLAGRFGFDGDLLVKALTSTFRRRRTEIPTELPLALTAEFLENATKQTQWSAFLRRTRPTEAPQELRELAPLLVPFVEPVIRAAGSGHSLGSRWPAGGLWTGR